MKKLIIADNNLNIGGIQKALVNLLKEIVDQYDVTLVLFEKNGELLDEIPGNVNVVSATEISRILGLSQAETAKKSKFLYILRAICIFWTRLFGNSIPTNLILGRKIRHKDFDYAISFMHFAPSSEFYGGTNEYVLNCIQAKRKITFVHSDFLRYGGNVKYVQKRYRKFDCIATCSKGCACNLIESIPEIAHKVKVVRNCNDFDSIRRFSEEKPILYNTNEFQVITVARLSKEKRIDRAVRAIANCINDGILIHYSIIGDGSEREHLNMLVRQLGIEKHVAFYGSQKNPYRFMRNADLFLLPSEHEAAPIVFDEARCLALPILATETISTTEMILEEQAGWVCHNSMEGIEISLRYLLGRPDLINSCRDYLKKQRINNLIPISQFHEALAFIDMRN